jgi:hypothetical protein
LPEATFSFSRLISFGGWAKARASSIGDSDVQQLLNIGGREKSYAGLKTLSIAGF